MIEQLRMRRLLAHCPEVARCRRQWPAEGTWLLRLSVRETTALVMFDRDGAVSSVRVPVRRSGTFDLPRAVSAREIDSTLAVAASR